VSLASLAHPAETQMTGIRLIYYYYYLFYFDSIRLLLCLFQSHALGDIVTCFACPGILNTHSQTKCLDEAMGSYLWVCEFCGYENDVTLEPGEKPSREHAEYVIKPAQNAGKQQQFFGMVLGHSCLLIYSFFSLISRVLYYHTLFSLTRELESDLRDRC
jgi:hypothetical protein